MKWLTTTLGTSIGKKLMMAATGLSFIGFLAVHLAGNLTLYGGADAFNSYAEHLHALGPLGSSDTLGFPHTPGSPDTLGPSGTLGPLLGPEGRWRTMMKCIAVYLVDRLAEEAKKNDRIKK